MSRGRRDDGVTEPIDAASPGILEPARDDRERRVSADPERIAQVLDSAVGAGDPPPDPLPREARTGS
jgi:hypothetical protein